MADAYTATLNLVKPEVGASTNTWGSKLSANMDLIDAEAAQRRAAATAVNESANLRVLRAGDTMTGQLTAPVLAIDGQCYVAKVGDLVAINLDGDDAIHFNRASNSYAVVVGGTQRFGLDASNASFNIPLTLAVGSTQNAHATRKDYVDAHINNIANLANSKLPLVGGTVTGDLNLTRPAAPNTGALYLGNSGARYLFFDGANYSMPGGQLFIANGNGVWHNGNLPAPASSNTYNVFSAQQSITCASPYLDLHWPGIYIWRQQVNGAANLCWTDQNNAVKMQLDPSGNVTAGNFITFSDAGVKADVQPIADALAKVKALQGKTFVRQDINDGERRMGFIAQEVQPVVPEVVRETGNLGLLGVTYGEMAALMAEAIKELSFKVEALEAQVATMLDGGGGSP